MLIERKRTRLVGRVKSLGASVVSGEGTSLLDKGCGSALFVLECRPCGELCGLSNSED